MFPVLLELPEFEVVNHEIFPTHYLVHVEKKTLEERCPHCGFLTSFVHDRRTRKIRDLTVMNKPVYLLVTIKRYRCLNCEEIFTASFESIDSYQHYTNRFQQFIYEQVLGTTIQDISRKNKMAYSTVERIFYSVADKKAAEHKSAIQEIQGDQDIALSLDEVAVRKGHKYETVLYDANLGAVLGLHHDRDYPATLELLSLKILHPERVKTVVLDMWDPFHKAIRKAFPSAQIVIDKYHVVQKVTQALDQVRKKIPGLKKARFHLLRSYEKVKEIHRPRLDELLESHESLCYAYFLKELFRDFYQSKDYETADHLLTEWLDLAWSSPFESFHEVAKTIQNWRHQIMQYFKTPYTNGRTEGTNHKIKNIKRRAYGYRNLHRFRTRVLLECTGHTYKKQVS
ncbi:ISL3 family transposase [Metabacillus arenae]|uniref:ISL3 family transposase n=1 Tax=Metabacillus arenae TaxID=2771434 RepID=A0A926NN07_9BACI|nr:ISL3 family transposase [Metabacillus arenae]MBD1383638.1 ISL3 family transposase [Metabacillus arenae]